MRRLPLLAVVVLPLLLSSRPSAAQESTAGRDGTATLRLRVRSALTGAPLAGARVRVVGPERRAVTDDAGVVVINYLDPGDYLLRVEALGHEPRIAPVGLRAGATLNAELEMTADAITLDTLSAEATRTWGGLRGTGFYERRAAGMGVFRTREEFEHLPQVRTSDILRDIPGLRVVRPGLGQTRVLSSRTRNIGGSCGLALYLDGVLMAAPGSEGVIERDTLSIFEWDDIDPATVEAIEVYRGPAETPPQFTSAISACGAVVIWTRRRP